MTDDLMHLPVGALAERVRSKHVSAREAVAASLAAITATNAAINAFVTVDGERAMAAASALDERIATDPSAAAGLPLAGVPLAVKDTEDTIGYRTTFGSRLWADAPPATRDSVLVARLKAAGAIVVGKTNTPELATRAETDSPLWGVTDNPLAPGYACGGSSGGSAAAVAARMVPLATGSDGGGSIRIPSAACAITGFKPSLGRVPDGGPHPVDWGSFTSRGVLARTLEELLVGYDVAVGPEATDLRSLPAPAQPWSVGVPLAPRPRRVAWSATLGYADVDPEITRVCRAALGRWAGNDIEIVEVEDVFEHDPGLAWSQLVSVWNERTLAPVRASIDAGVKIDDVTALLRSLATTVTTEAMVAADDLCHHLNLRLVALFADVDLLLTPTLAQLPPAHGTVGSWIQHTYPFNMTRSPAGTSHAGWSAATPERPPLPIALQVVGPQHGDIAVLAALATLESAAASE